MMRSRATTVRETVARGRGLLEEAVGGAVEGGVEGTERELERKVEGNISVLSWSFPSLPVYYRISQNFRDLKISRITAKMGIRNVRE